MKTKLAKILVIGVSSLAIVLPLQVSAADSVPTIEFCTKEVSRYTDAKVDEAKTVYLAKLNASKAKEIDKLNKENQKLTAQAVEQKTKTDVEIDKKGIDLLLRANSTAKTDAVTAFKTTMHTAVTTRHTAYTAAIAKLKADKEPLINNYFTARTTLANTYATEVKAAYIAARTACAAATPAPAAIKHTMLGAVHAASTKQKEDIKDLDRGLKASVKTASGVYKQAVAEAKRIYKAKSTDELKKVNQTLSAP